MLKNIDIGKKFTKGLKADRSGFAKRYKLFGADTETYNGYPLSLQFYDGNGQNNVDFIWVNKDTVFDTFVDYITANCLTGYPNYYYYHNLTFDLGIIFFPYVEKFVEHSQIEFDYKGIKVNAIYGTTTTANFTYKKTNIKLLDSKAFMSGGTLEKWAEILNLPFKKMKRPDGIGEIDYFKLKDSDEKKKYFVEYAKTDVLTQYYLGEWILQQHKNYNVPVSCSSAHFSSRVFKRGYLSNDKKIPFPPKACLNGALLSYHGGRNGYYWDKPAVFENCCEVDISSSYPFAMVSIPNFVECEYKYTQEYNPNYAGLYEVVGQYHACKYPPFFTHDLKSIQDGSMFRVWVTSYELAEAIKDGTVDENFRIANGYLVIPSRNKRIENPFVKFVTEFYSKKELKGIDKSERHMYKIILNSLYGKFIQTIVDDYQVNDLDVDEQIMNISRNSDGSFNVIHAPTNTHIYVAGGLFQPVIATFITGFARAYLHRLEHKFNAIHSSTDSVKFNAKLLDAEHLASYRRKLAGNKDKGVLGSYGVEVIGKCILLRNKLYLHYNEKGEIEKQAFHGFAGRQKELLEIINSKNVNYTISRMLKIREAYKQGLQPFVMTKLKKELDVDLSKMQVVTDKEY